MEEEKELREKLEKVAPIDIALAALYSIKTWDEGCEDIWDDPGACASDAIDNILEKMKKARAENEPTTRTMPKPCNMHHSGANCVLVDPGIILLCGDKPCSLTGVPASA